MTVQAKAGTFAFDSTGWGVGTTHDFTGFGFTPQLVMLFDLGAALDAVNAGMFCGMGFSDGTNNYAVSSEMGDGKTVANGSKTLRTDVCLYFKTESAGVRGSLTASMLADGFRVTVATAVNSFPRKVGYLAIGGLTNVKLGARTTPSATGTFDTTGLGFQPDGLILAGANNATVPDDDAFNIGMGFGVATASAQASMGWSAQHSSPPSNTRTRWNTASVLTLLTENADTVLMELALSAFIADGFTLNKLSGSSTSGFIWAAFKGGSPSLNVESTRTTAGTIVRSGLGVSPAALLLFGSGHASASETLPTGDARFGIGAGDGTNQWAVGSVSPDGLNPTEADQINSPTLAWLRGDVTGTTAFIGTSVGVTTLATGGYTLTQGSVDASAHQFAVLAIGESATPATDNDPAQTTASVPSVTAGSTRNIVVTARKSDGSPMTTGGATVVVTITGSNPATPTVTDNGNGTYSCATTPTTVGTDSVAITLNGTAISGSPYSSTVSASGGSALRRGTNMLTTVRRKYGEATTLDFVLASYSGPDLNVSATFAAGDLKIAKDEGAAANTTNLPVDKGSYYSLDLTAAELTAKRVVITVIDQTSPNIWLPDVIVIETTEHPSSQHPDPFLLDAGTAQSATAGGLVLRAGAPATPPGSILLITSATAGANQAGVIASRATDTVTLQQTWVEGGGVQPTGTILYKVYAAPPAPAVVAADLVRMTGDATIAGKMAAAASAIITGTVQAGTITTSSFPTNLPGTVAEQYDDRILVFRSDTTTVALRGVSKPIDAFTVSGGVIALGYRDASNNFVGAPLPVAPVAGDTFAVL
jgi:hypothetical protein